MAVGSGDGRLASGRPPSVLNSVSESFRLGVLRGDGGVIDGSDDEANVDDDAGSSEEVFGGIVLV